MNKFYQKWGHTIAIFILFVASNAATRCAHNFYQRKVPDKLKARKLPE
ncbi:cyclic lactone autoinducer peptide [Lacrimispora brassicae]